ncbi:MAG: 4Fe-4S dicluster domain-containing protein [Gammaproteobacteria bacterium]|nr:4Fe-4S dicluster domain-containing protein [Gammaproteobacteria bacterium]
MSDQHINSYRRRFLGGAGALAALTVAPGLLLNVVKAKPAAEAVSNTTRWGLLIDANKCGEGCNDCVTGCNEEHGLKEIHGPATDAQWIRSVTVRDTSTQHVTHLPMMCQHCESAPCVDVCPTGASFKREDGIVLVDKHTCIGCRYCMMACPYKARSFVHEHLTEQKPVAPRGIGTVESCTMCVHRVDKNGENTVTACAEACTHDAILFGDLNNPESDISKRLEKEGGTRIRADLGLNPGVRYQGI